MNKGERSTHTGKATAGGRGRRGWGWRRTRKRRRSDSSSGSFKVLRATEVRAQQNGSREQMAELASRMGIKAEDPSKEIIFEGHVRGAVS